jgi:hypothetical protein
VVIRTLNVWGPFSDRLSAAARRIAGRFGSDDIPADSLAADLPDMNDRTCWCRTFGESFGGGCGGLPESAATKSKRPSGFGPKLCPVPASDADAQAAASNSNCTSRSSLFTSTMWSAHLKTFHHCTPEIFIPDSSAVVTWPYPTLVSSEGILRHPVGIGLPTGVVVLMHIQSCLYKMTRPFHI